MPQDGQVIRRFRAFCRGVQSTNFYRDPRFLRAGVYPLRYGNLGIPLASLPPGAMSEWAEIRKDAEGVPQGDKDGS